MEDELFELEMEDVFEEEDELLEDDLADLEDGLSDDLGNDSIEEEVVKKSEEVIEPTKELETTVERYASQDLSYPCFVLQGDVEFPKHVISALSRMIESTLGVKDTIKVYVTVNEELLSLGGISPIQVKAVIDLLGRGNISAYYSKGYLLTGDLIYTLSL